MYGSTAEDSTQPLLNKNAVNYQSSDPNGSSSAGGTATPGDDGHDAHEGPGHGHSHRNSRGKTSGDGHCEDEHIDVGDGGLRAVVFGFSDGLVTNLCLILGIYSAGQIDHQTIILTGVAGLLAGAASMAIGEWISMKIQAEASEAQLNLEREHLKEFPRDEEAHFREILEENGLTDATIAAVLKDVGNCPVEQQVKWHGLLELKIDPEELGGSPMKAAFASFVGFGIGAFIPLLPWICTKTAPLAFWVTIGLSTFCVLLLGLMLAVNLGLERKLWLWVILRQLLVVVVATAVVIGCNNGISKVIHK